MTTATAERKLATRHYCPNRDATGHTSFHTAGPGKPRGAGRCRYCATHLVTITGLWGVFTWRGDSRYRETDAHSTHLSEPAAERAQVKACEQARAQYGYGAPGTSLVVRWVHADS